LSQILKKEPFVTLKYYKFNNKILKKEPFVTLKYHNFKKNVTPLKKENNLIMNSKEKLPIYVALDLDDKDKALLIAKKVSPYVEGFKIGPRLYLKEGQSMINQLKPYGKIFLDFKFFDIPSTMVSAVKTAFDLGVDMLTVHVAAGKESLRQIADIETHLNSKREFKVLAVTMLTSFSRSTLPPLMQPYSMASHVESLSDMAVKSGLSGLVCSGEDLKFLKKRHQSTYLITPGIRFLLSKKQDQKRVFTPRKAIEAGANGLVIGRPIYQSKDPVKVCLKLIKEFST